MEEESNPETATSILDFTATDIDGMTVGLEKYRDHVCVIVNVASYWALAEVNYQQLVEMYTNHSEAPDGLRVLAFPCNQFANQEPETNEVIKEFVDGYNVEFDIFDKIDVNGDNSHPIFQYLKSKFEETLNGNIQWNFTKFVIDRNGIPSAVFGPKTNPIPDVLDHCKTLF